MSAALGPEGSRALVRALEASGVEVVFGLPGTQNHALYVALRGSSIRSIVPTHELAAAFMAGAYGRMRRDVGVLLTIPGPGFAYALPGLAEAWLDSAPLVHITCAPPAGSPLKLQHQAIDQRALARPIVKGILAASEPTEIERAVRAARALALDGEPGPVLIELGGEAVPAFPPPPHHGDPQADARRIWQRIGTARRPVLFLGQGSAGAAAAASEFVARAGLPFFTNASGRGVVSEASPWCLRYDALRQPSSALNAFLDTTDLAIVIGARLAYNGSAGFGLALPPERLVRIDTAPEPGRYPAALSARLDAARFFAMSECASTPRSAWTVDEIGTWRDRIGTLAPKGPEPSVAGRTPREFVEDLRAALPDEAVLVTDTGLHQSLVRRYYEVRSVDGLLIPSDLQSMGFGLPAALAAKLADPSRPVVAVIGDGGALMSGLELATAVRERLAVTVLVFNDGHLNQIRLAQLQDAGRAHGTTLPALDFAALARAAGARYLRLDSDDFTGVRAAVAGNDVTLVEVVVRDSPAVVRSVAAARAKAVLRATLGERLTAWVKRQFRR